MAKRSTTQKNYEVSIVGESHYREAVKATDVGDYVDLVIERDNPHADGGNALRVDNMDGDKVGYVPTDNWLYAAIVKEGQGCLAKVEFKGGKPAGIRLKVQLGEKPCPEVAYGERLHSQKPKSGCFGVLAGALLLSLVPIFGKFT